MEASESNRSNEELQAGGKMTDEIGIIDLVLITVFIVLLAVFVSSVAFS